MPDANPIHAGLKSILGDMAGAMPPLPAVTARSADPPAPAKTQPPPAPILSPALPGLGGKLDLYDTSEPAHLGSLSPERTGDTLASLALGDFSQGLASRETGPLVDLPFLIPLGKASAGMSPPSAHPHPSPLPGSGLGRTLDTAG